MKNWVDIFKNKDSKEAIGEILKVQHKYFEFQLYDFYHIPDYSSFVAALAGDEIHIGIVTSQAIEPLIPLTDRLKPLRRKREELSMDYKDILDKFAITCGAIIVAYVDDKGIKQGRPNKIPLVHDLVFIPDKELIRDMHLVNEEGIRYIPIIYNTLPRDERNLFNYFLEVYFRNLMKYFNKEEMYLLLRTLHSNLEENYLGDLIDSVNRAFEKALKINKYG